LSYKEITAKEKLQIKNFLAGFIIVQIDDEIRDQTIEIKKSTHLKLPDSIIAATAIVFDMPFVTSDKQFKTVNDLDLLFYER
jgi:predicted nucleic acid-binding protein